MSSLLSTATVAIVGFTCKAAFKLGLLTVSVRGLPTLLNALQDPSRDAGHGLVTVCNHISTIDDPLTWGVLPSRCYFSSRMMRWTMGASDIMFTNPIFSAFFRNGQVIETFRGKGIFQEAVSIAIQKLNQGEWVHFYPEGKVNQPNTYRKDASGAALLPRFKWGIGRVLCSTTKPPVVLPMWITGFENVMPEGRKFPFKFFPRFGKHVSITFGDPIPPSELAQVIAGLHSKRPDIIYLHTEVTSMVHRTLVSLGRSVIGS